MGIFHVGRSDKMQIVTPEEALAGRDEPIVPGRPHLVIGTPMTPPYPAGSESAIVAMGCFWGAERVFWTMPGVVTTAVGYSGGYTPNPTYEEVCTGRTGHAEAVLVVFSPSRLSYGDILAAFFERHDPTQGMRQGNDLGTQYRSALFATTPDQLRQATAARDAYDAALAAQGMGPATTEIAPAGPFYFAEDYHQQYLAANPSGYCGLGGTGVCFPAASPRTAR